MAFYCYLLLFLCFTSTLADCPATYNPKDIFTGFFLASTVSNVDLNINQTIGNYNYQMATPFSRVPQVAIATSVIEGPLRIDQYYRISVNAATSQLLFSVNMSYGSNNWQFIRVDFMAETRSDMELGIYQSAVTNFGVSQQFTTSLTSVISNPVVVTFVSGFEVANLDNSPYSISVTNAVASGNTLNFSVNTNFLKTVFVSYIVYDSSSLQRSFLVAQGSVGLGISSVNNTKFFAGTTNLFGFNGFVSSSNNYFDYSSRVNSKLSINVTTKTISSVAVSYIVIETLPSQYCSTCNTGSIYQQGYCVMICDSSSIPATQNGAQTCVICDIENFMIKTEDNSSCVCAIQYYQPQGSPSCVSCDPSCVSCNGPSAQSCTSCDLTPSVGTNRVLVNGACNCISKYYSDSNTGYSCVPCHYSCLTCSGVNNNNCLSCSVNVGRSLSGSSCTCRSGYTDNGQSQACVCTNPLPNGSCSVPISCQQNQVIVNNTCQCASGYFNISGQCTQCSSNQYFSNGACVNCVNGQVSSSRTECNCINGFYKIGGTCQQCKTNEVYSNTTQNCVCGSGFFSVNGSCQRPPTNQVYNGSTFVCSTGFFNISGVCSTCQGNQVYNSTTQSCGCTGELVLVNGQCQVQTPINNNTNPNNTNPNNNTNTNQTCPANSIRTNGVCVCLNSFYNISGNCTQCPQNGYFNGQSCVCYPGYYNISGNCTNTPTCTGQFQYFNGVTCICYPGYSNNSGNCTYGCGTNQVLTQTGCQCMNGFYNISGNCTSCPQNSYFNGVECICNGGLYLLDRVCTSCGLNSVYNGSACVCSQGTYNISGSCQSCPANSNYNGTSCVCINGYTMNSQNTCVLSNTNTNTSNNSSANNSQCGFGSWNGYQCVCNQGYYLIQGKCNVCPNGAYFNGQTCICYGGTNYINGVCASCPNFSYFNGVTCVCYGGLVYANNNCVSCPTNSFSTGTSCQCSFGTYSNASNTCVVCNSPATFNGSACVCPSGYYLQQSSCAVCSRGCSICSGPNSCTTCNNGFTLTNGACSESGPTTPTTPTTPNTTNRVNITNQGFTIYTGYVGAAIVLNPFPPALQINNCQLCGNVLQTTIISGASPQILTGFTAPSTLHVLFGFGLSQMRPFVASVGINPQYSSYFPGMDISQRITLNVTQNVINGRG